MSVTINASTSTGLVQAADTSGTIELQSNGTTRFTVASTGAYGQLVSATAQASTSGTSIDFTSIPSWVKRITVMFSGVSTNGTSNYLIQLGDSGGIENTGYTTFTSTLTATTQGLVGNTNGAGFYIIVGAAASTVSGSVIFSLLDSNSWTGQGIMGVSTPSSVSHIGGVKTLSATLDRVRITTVNGTDTFDAGSINIMYEG
jgi:hypothetical protein